MRPIVICSLVTLGCAPTAQPFKQATAVLEPRSDSSAYGVAEFFTEAKGVSVQVRIAGAAPGPHGLHLHQTGDCSAADGTSAGPHWNPGDHAHGEFGDGSHAGDLGNIVIGANGAGLLELTSTRWSILGDEGLDVVGRAVILHADSDKFTGDAGGAGKRIGCGVVRWGAIASGLAVLVPRSGSTVRGMASFERAAGKDVTLKLSLTGLTPGLHAVHVHDKGDCSSPDAMSAGGHWNPAGSAHGHLGTGAHHAGDIGNVSAGADGTAVLTMSSSEWELRTGGSLDLIGHAVIVHTAADDLMSQPAGNAGARVACGTIVGP